MALWCRWDRHAISATMWRIAAISFTPMHESLRCTKTAQAQHASRLCQVAAMLLLAVWPRSCGTQSQFHAHPLTIAAQNLTSLRIPMNIHVLSVPLMRKTATRRIQQCTYIYIYMYIYIYISVHVTINKFSKASCIHYWSFHYSMEWLKSYVAYAMCIIWKNSLTSQLHAGDSRFGSIVISYMCMYICKVFWNNTGWLRSVGSL